MATSREQAEAQEHGVAAELPHGPSVSRRNFIAGLGAASGAVVVGVAMRGVSPGGAAWGPSLRQRRRPTTSSARRPSPPSPQATRVLAWPRSPS